MRDGDPGGSTVTCTDCGAKVARDEVFGVEGDERCERCADGIRRRFESARLRHASGGLRRPIATIAVLVVVAALFVVQEATARRSATEARPWIATLQQNVTVWTGSWWRHLTSTLLHAGPLHLVMNGFVFWQLGRLFEAAWGRTTLLTVVLAAGTAGSAASWIFNAPVPTVGISGGIFGLATFLFALKNHHPVAAAVATPYLRNQLLAWFGICLVLTYTGTLPISNSGHAVGAVVGWILGRVHVARLERFQLVVGAIIVLAACLVAQFVTFGTYEGISRADLRRHVIELHARGDELP